MGELGARCDITTTVPTVLPIRGHIVFVARRSCTTDSIGKHAAKRGTRFEALEPIRQGVRERFGEIGDGVSPRAPASIEHAPRVDAAVLTPAADDFRQDEDAFIWPTKGRTQPHARNFREERMASRNASVRGSARSI